MVPISDQCHKQRICPKYHKSTGALREFGYDNSQFVVTDSGLNEREQLFSRVYVATPGMNKKIDPLRVGCCEATP